MKKSQQVLLMTIHVGSLIDVVKFTDETKRLNQDIDKRQSHVVDVDKRVVRL